MPGTTRVRGSLLIIKIRHCPRLRCHLFANPYKRVSSQSHSHTLCCFRYDDNFSYNAPHLRARETRHSDSSLRSACPIRSCESLGSHIVKVHCRVLVLALETLLSSCIACDLGTDKNTPRNASPSPGGFHPHQLDITC